MQSFLSKLANVIISYVLLPLCFLEVKDHRQNNCSLEESFDFAISACRGLFKPYQFKSEIIRVLEYLSQMKPQYLLEIGTARGGLLFLLCKIASDDATVISVDLPRGYFWLKIPLYRSFARRGQKVVLIRNDSHAHVCLRRIACILKSHPLDVLFIDGDHSYEGVKKDYQMYSPLVRSGGAVVFHDIVKHRLEAYCEVERLWNEVKINRKYMEFVEDEKQGSAGIGVIIVP